MQRYYDELFPEAARVVIVKNKASVGLLQRQFKIGFNRASRIMDQLYEAGVIGEERGTAPRLVLMNEDQFEELLYAISNRKETDTEIERSTNIDRYYKLKDQLWPNGCEIHQAKGGEGLSEIPNVLFTGIDPDDMSRLVVGLILQHSPQNLRLLLCGQSFFRYHDAPHLLREPSRTTIEAIRDLDVLVSEIEVRKSDFLEIKVKNIDEYNKKCARRAYLKREQIPHIVFIVEELYYLSQERGFQNAIMPLLLDGCRCGVHLVLFSQLNKQGLKLGKCSSLLVEKHYIDDILHINNRPAQIRGYDITSIDNMISGIEFEEFSALILRRNGFSNVEVTKASGDFGVDVIAYKDEIKYAIQCKKYSSPVGISAVQEVIGSMSMYDCHVGVVLTNNVFTKAAIELAAKNRVLLWDREKLLTMIENAGLSTKIPDSDENIGYPTSDFNNSRCILIRDRDLISEITNQLMSIIKYKLGGYMSSDEFKEDFYIKNFRKRIGKGFKLLFIETVEDCFIEAHFYSVVDSDLFTSNEFREKYYNYMDEVFGEVDISKTQVIHLSMGFVIDDVHWINRKIMTSEPIMYLRNDTLEDITELKDNAAKMNYMWSKDSILMPHAEEFQIYSSREFL